MIGHLSEDLYFFGRKSASAAMRVLGEVLFFVLPNLERLNLKGQVSLLEPVGSGQVVGATLYGLVYVACFMGLAIAVFIRRDLK